MKRNGTHPVGSAVTAIAAACLALMAACTGPLEPEPQRNLPVPGGLTVHAVTSRSVSFSWDAVDSAECYMVTRRGPGDTAFGQIDSVTESRCTDSLLRPASTYAYKVRACFVDTVSPYSGEIRMRTTSPVPQAPELFHLEYDGRVVTLTWPENTDIGTTHYEVYRAAEYVINTIIIRHIPGSFEDGESFSDPWTRIDTSYILQNCFRARVPVGTGRYVDAPDTVSGFYGYWVRPVYADLLDTVVGDFFPPLPGCSMVDVDRTIQGPWGISFNINQCADTTVSDTVRLYARDPADRLVSFRVSAITGAGNDPASPPVAGDNLGQWRDLQVFNAAYMSSQQAGLIPWNYSDTKFDFEAADPLNPERSFVKDDVRQGKSVSWVLTAGSGMRYLAIEAVYDRIDGREKVDTLYARIRKWRRMPVINVIADSMTTLIADTICSGMGSYIIVNDVAVSTPVLITNTFIARRPAFSIAIDVSDFKGVAEEAELWLLAPLLNSQITPARLVSSSTQFMMSRQVRVRFDPGRPCTLQYRFDPATVDGDRVFGTVRKGNSRGFTEIMAAPAENYKSFFTLGGNLYGPVLFDGVRQVIVCARFFNTVEGDTLFTIANLVAPGLFDAVCVDTYLPRIRNNFTNNLYVTEGRLAQGSFWYGIDRLIDAGQAKTTSVSFVAVKKPSWMFWNGAHSSALFDYENIARSGGRLFPADVPVPASDLPQFKWNIDCSAWEPGEYVCGLFVADEFGNKGFAAGETGAPNPFLITVLSGGSE